MRYLNVGPLYLLMSIIIFAKINCNKISHTNSSSSEGVSTVKPINNTVVTQHMAMNITSKNSTLTNVSMPSLIASEGGPISKMETGNIFHSKEVTKAPELHGKVTFKPNKTSIHNVEKPAKQQAKPVITSKPIQVSTPSPSSTSSTKKPYHKKPSFTMVPDDKDSKESESFIESSSTGRDYVLPIVLCILALPLVVFIIKFIYKRGTEFTERQQYHRMYLIDGMYNTRITTGAAQKKTNQS